MKEITNGLVGKRVLWMPLVKVKGNHKAQSGARLNNNGDLRWAEESKITEIIEGFVKFEGHSDWAPADAIEIIAVLPKKKGFRED